MGGYFNRSPLFNLKTINVESLPSAVTLTKSVVYKRQAFVNTLSLLLPSIRFKNMNLAKMFVDARIDGVLIYFTVFA